ncbi:MAG: GNAT family N-acetyltransferase [Pseudomonadota bacterium]
MPANPPATPDFCGYYPGAIGQVAALHAAYYAEHWGFDLSFEAQVATELSRFLLDFDPARDFFRAARAGERLAGAVALDGHSTPHEGARLRWFIVHKTWQGSGLGARLLEQALAFARQASHRRLYLWTFAGLEAARCLYERAGFCLAEQKEIQHWGGVIHDQRYDLELA